MLLHVNVNASVQAAADVKCASQSSYKVFYAVLAHFFQEKSLRDYPFVTCVLVACFPVRCEKGSEEINRDIMS